MRILRRWRIILWRIRDYLSKIKRAGDIMRWRSSTIRWIFLRLKAELIVLKPAPIGCGEVIGRIAERASPGNGEKSIFILRWITAGLLWRPSISILPVLRKSYPFIQCRNYPEGGNVAFIVECLKLEPACVHDRIIVRDSGCGISPSSCRSFEPFSQETQWKMRTSGFRPIVHCKAPGGYHGGTIDVKRPGEGTKLQSVLTLNAWMKDRTGKPLRRGRNRSAGNGYDVRR